MVIFPHRVEVIGAAELVETDDVVHRLLLLDHGERREHPDLQALGEERRLLRVNLRCAIGAGRDGRSEGGGSERDAGRGRPRLGYPRSGLSDGAALRWLVRDGPLAVEPLHLSATATWGKPLLASGLRLAAAGARRVPLSPFPAP